VDWLRQLEDSAKPSMWEMLVTQIDREVPRRFATGLEARLFPLRVQYSAPHYGQ